MKKNAVLRILTVILLAGAFVLLKIVEKVFGKRIWIALLVLVALVGFWLRFLT